MAELVVTKAGYKKLQDELNTLINVSMPEIKNRMVTAREDGDLSENNPFITAKEDMDAAVFRIAELQRQLKEATIVEDNESEFIGMGDTIVIQIGSTKMTIKIVSSIEADATKQLISPESPLGSILMGKKIGDTVTFITPAGEQKVKIISRK